MRIEYFIIKIRDWYVRMNFDFMQMGETSYSYFDVMLSRAQFLLSLLGDVSEFCFDCLCQMMEPKENEEQ